MNVYLPPNYVYVKPDGKIESDRTGLVRRDFVDAHNQLSVTGVVVGVCDRLFFEPYSSTGHPELIQQSIAQDVPLEIKAGDRVLYRYLANVDQADTFGDGIVIKYDELYAIIREDGSLYPLNGYIFIVPDDDIQEYGGIIRASEKKASWLSGLVTHEGCLVKQYQMYDFGDEPMGCLEGRRIGYTRGHAVRIEADEYAQHALGDWSLYRIHRKDIRLIC